MLVGLSGRRERHDVARGRGGSGQQRRDGVQPPRPRAAVGVDQRAGGLAQARPAPGLDSRSISASSSSRPSPPAPRPRPREERLGDLGEVLHVRAEDDGLAVDRRLEDVVAADVHQAAADEHGRRHLVDLRQFANRIEDDDVGLDLLVDGEAVRRTVRNPACRASASASAKCSGLRGARTSSGLPASVRTRSKARSTISCSPGIVLPATTTGRRSATVK